MHSILFKANKLLLIERDRNSCITANYLPREYYKLIIPCAAVHFREDKECEILSQHIAAGPFSFGVHDIFAKEKIIVLPYSPYHIWTLHFMYEDNLTIEGIKQPSYLLEERECNMFNLQPGLHPVPMAGNKKVLSVHVNIRPETFPTMARRYPQLKGLLSRRVPAVSCVLNARPHPTSAVCDLLIQNIMTCRYTGTRANIFISRCILDLLINYAQRETYMSEPFLYSSLVHRDTFRQVLHFIMDHPHKHCTPAELAFMFDLPLTELTMGFQQHFAMSVEEFSHMYRMMLAYNLLHEGEITLADIAGAAGFQDARQMVKQLEAYYDFSVRD